MFDSSSGMTRFAIAWATVRPMQRLLAASRYAYSGIAVALLIGIQIEIWVTPGLNDRWALSLLGLVAGVAILVAPRFTLAAPLVAVFALAGQVAIDASGVNDMVTPLFIVLLSAWCIGAYNRPPYAFAGLAVLFPVLIWVILSFPDNGVGAVFWITLFVTAAWLAGFTISHQARQTERLKELAAQLKAQQGRMAEEAVQEERSRIARELHDVVAHHVSVMTVQAGAVRRLLTPDQQREREALMTVEETGRKALTEMRRLLGVLKQGEAPAPLSPQPGLATLDALLVQVRDAGLPVELAVEGDPVELPPGVDLSAYRIVQEALTNALKYAGPARAWVLVRYGEKDVTLEIANDGTSDSASGNGGGHGLVGMRERVAVYGGELESGPRAGGGFAVRARLPIGSEDS